ncbi:hypothetical protein RI129_007435 [Pyrocoelia pectoralis]|uniref:THAP-type domain-containing protein n=1 Tax=Pyrocoelia pectoralis TaxID=417401 RepID=A0AAN7V809_9COLE
MDKYRRCVYHNCFNTQKNAPNLSFFEFPIQSRQLYMKWVQNSGNFKFFPYHPKLIQNKFICEKHFSLESFRKINGRKLLNLDAVPMNVINVSISNDTLIPKTKPTPKSVDEIKVPIITSTTTLRTYGNQKLLQDTTKQTSFNDSNGIEMIKNIKQETELCDTQPPSFNFCDEKEIFLQDTKEEVEPSVINPEPINNHIECISPVEYNKLKRRLTRLNVTNRRIKQENFRLRKKPGFNEALYRNLEVKSPSVKTFVLMQIVHKRGTEWTQSEKDLALSIYMKSPTTYRFLFKSLGFALPSPKTISTWSLPKS